ncbi:MAG: N-6 DNA methylase [Rhodoferax sp.]|nr:N-6 DNA methylase [Rhodoferax sp.]
MKPCGLTSQASYTKRGRHCTFEQAFKNIDADLRNEAGCTTELDYTEQTSWLLFLKYLDGLEQDKAMEAELEGRKYAFILDEPYRWSSWAAPRDKDGKLDHIDELRFGSQAEKHELSHLYEAKIKNMGNAGRNGGEYYTPRPLIRAMVQVVQPEIGERIYDGACGSAGFLCESFDYLRNQPKLTADNLKTLQERTFYGKEKKPLAYVIAIMNMILHGIEAPNIIHTNTLTENLSDIQDKDRMDVILANPPFGGGERKELLLESCNLHTVLDCPGGTFQGAGVKTVVLFFEKGTPTRKVWYYQLDPGRNMGKTNPLNDADLYEFVELQKTQAITAKSWSVDAATIDTATYDLSVKNPNGGEEVIHRSPQDIMDEIAALDAEAAEVLTTIRDLL